MIVVIDSLSGAVLQAFKYTGMATSVSLKYRSLIMGKSLLTPGSYNLYGHIKNMLGGSYLFSFEISFNPPSSTKQIFAKRSTDTGGA